MYVKLLFNFLQALLKKEDDLKNEEDLKNENDLKNEDDLKRKTILFFCLYSASLGDALTTLAVRPFLLATY